MDKQTLDITKGSFNIIADSNGIPKTPGLTTRTMVDGIISQTIAPAFANGKIYFALTENNNSTNDAKKAYIYLDNQTDPTNDETRSRYYITGPVYWSEVLGSAPIAAPETDYGFVTNKEQSFEGIKNFTNGVIIQNKVKLIYNNEMNSLDFIFL